MKRAIGAAMLTVGLALAQGTLEIAGPAALPDAVQGQFYQAPLRANRTGTTWSLAGTPPAWLHIDPASGELSGSPPMGGDVAVTVMARDAEGRQAQRAYGLHVSGLALRWLDKPALDGTTLAGSVEVVNASSAAADLTVIAYGINDSNKAFALGYQHVAIAPGQRIAVPFQSDLPAGRYHVHVDAVGGPSRQTIYRSHLDTGDDFTIAPPSQR